MPTDSIDSHQNSLGTEITQAFKNVQVAVLGSTSYWVDTSDSAYTTYPAAEKPVATTTITAKQSIHSVEFQPGDELLLISDLFECETTYTYGSRVFPDLDCSSELTFTDDSWAKGEIWPTNNIPQYSVDKNQFTFFTTENVLSGSTYALDIYWELEITASLAQTDRLTGKSQTFAKTTVIQLLFTNNCQGKTGYSIDEASAPADQKITMINSGLIDYEYLLPFRFKRVNGRDNAVMCSVDDLTFHLVIRDSLGADVTQKEPFASSWDESAHLLTLGTTSQDITGSFTLEIIGTATFLNIDPYILVSKQTIVIKSCICELEAPVLQPVTYDLGDPQSETS